MRRDRHGNIVLNKQEIKDIKYALLILKDAFESVENDPHADKAYQKDSKNALGTIKMIAVLLGAVD